MHWFESSTTIHSCWFNGRTSPLIMKYSSKRHWLKKDKLMTEYKLQQQLDDLKKVVEELQGIVLVLANKLHEMSDGKQN